MGVEYNISIAAGNDRGFKKMCGFRKRKYGTAQDICSAGFQVAQKLIIEGKRNTEIRQFLKDNAHISNLSDSWFYNIRKTPQVQDMFSRAMLEAAQSQYTPRARRIDVLNIGIDEILKSMGIRLINRDGQFNSEEIKQSLTEDRIERESIQGDAAGAVSGSIIDQLDDSEHVLVNTTRDAQKQAKRERDKEERERKRSNCFAWAEIRNLLNQIRVEMGEYEGNIALGQSLADPETVDAMAEDIAKQKLYALIESMEAEVADIEGVLVPVNRSITE